MRDFRKFLGRTVGVYTADGTFQGELVAVGRRTLTLKVERYFDSTGEQGRTPKGVVVVDRDAVRFVEVR